MAKKKKQLKSKKMKVISKKVKIKAKPAAAKKTKNKAAISKKIKTQKTKSTGASQVAKKLVKALVNKQQSVEFYPLADRVLIEQSDGFSKTEGGLFIPDAYQEKPLEGKVLRVGPGFRSKKGALRPVDIQPGDRVMFAKYAGSKIQLDGQNYLVLSESDIIGVVTK